MSLNDTPSANRVHIGFFGRRNAGKSSLVNAFTGQNVSIVSDVLGTTTDTVKKAMELLPLGPVVIVDTPGFDDDGTLGEMRVKAAEKALKNMDAAVLVCDVQRGIGECEKKLIALFNVNKVKYITAYTKKDTLKESFSCKENEILVSSVTGENINELKEMVAGLLPTGKIQLDILGDIIKNGDYAVLVTPIDASAPKGRIILPQQQVLRDILDSGAAALVVKEDMLSGALSSLKEKPKIVITDSQVFEKVSKDTPVDIPLTSFSILMARFKGILAPCVRGAGFLDHLKDGQNILIAEGCTHHRQCEDIGSVKLPRLLKKHTGADLKISIVSGHEYPDDLSCFDMIIHCGGCMLTEREIRNRMYAAESQGIPFTNYGIAIAHMHGILKRSLEPFPDVLSLLTFD